MVDTDHDQGAGDRGEEGETWTEDDAEEGTEEADLAAGDERSNLLCPTNCQNLLSHWTQTRSLKLFDGVKPKYFSSISRLFSASFHDFILDFNLILETRLHKTRAPCFRVFHQTLKALKIDYFDLLY